MVGGETIPASPKGKGEERGLGIRKEKGFNCSAEEEGVVREAKKVVCVITAGKRGGCRGWGESVFKN